MPLVTARPRSLQNGSILTEFFDTTSTTSVTYTFPTPQTTLIIENSGEKDVFVTVGSYTNQVVKVDKKWQVDVSFTSFAIRSDVNSQEFMATAIFKDAQNLSEVNSKVDGITVQLAGTVKKVNGVAPVNGNVTIDVPEIDTTNLATKTELNAVASGSPKGTYATLADLQTAFPTGNANIYVVTADGKWYYWKSSAWTAGGVYQSTKIANKSVGVEELSVIESTSNMFNKNDVTLGKVLSAGSGTPTDNASYQLSNFISVTPNDKHTSKKILRTTYFDANKAYLANFTNVSTNLETPLVTTAPATAAFMRLSVLNSYANIAQINKGETLAPYEEYANILKGVSLSQEIIDDVGSKLDLNSLLKSDDRYMFDLPVDGLFDTSEAYNGTEYSTFGSATKSAEVYALYDNLMASYPDYITKQVLGNDAFGNPISLYKFKPTRPQTSITTKLPKVFITTGTHGYEHVPGLMTYLMFKQMCEKWKDYPQLEVLRFNVEFLVIPVVNPSGWDDYTRTNRNGVDINRNFPEGWVLGTQGTNTYGGTAPLTELESQYVKAVFDNNPDIAIMYDFHNFAGDSTTNYFIWLATSSGAYVQHMVQKLIGRMTRKWRKEYAFIPTDYNWFAGYTDATGGGMIQDHALGRGIKYTGTFEVCGRWWIEDPANVSALPYNTTHKTTSVEALVNWLLINLNELL